MSVDSELPSTAADMSRTPHIAVDRGTNEMTRPSRLQLTQEEIRILEECNKESLLYRSMPLAAVAMAATQFAVNKGWLKAHPRWGSTFKLLGAGFVSWFGGKLSYQSVCEDKFLRLKNSPVADLIRKKRGITLQLTEDRPPSDEMLYADDAPCYAVDDDFVSSSRSLNLDTDKNIQYAGLDDSDRFRDEYDMQPEDKPTKFTTTYDDLRRKNRQEYELRQSKLFAPSSPSYMPTSSSKDWRSHDDKPSGTSQSSYQPENSLGTQNVFGDRWDK